MDQINDSSRHDQVFIAAVLSGGSDKLYMGFGKPVKGKYMLFDLPMPDGLAADLLLDQVTEVSVAFDPVKGYSNDMLFDNIEPKAESWEMPGGFEFIKRVVFPPTLTISMIERIGASTLRDRLDKAIQETRMASQAGSMDRRAAFDMEEHILVAKKRLEVMVKASASSSNLDKTQDKMLDVLRLMQQKKKKKTP